LAPVATDFGGVFPADRDNLEEAEGALAIRDRVAVLAEVASQYSGHLSPPDTLTAEDEALALGFILLNAVDVGLSDLAHIN